MVVSKRVVISRNDGDFNFVGGLTMFMLLFLLCVWREIAEHILEMFPDQAQE